jgi:hypothetical protein
MLLNIIFSYNRAMQLDFLLQSILKRFRIVNYEIAILYHTTGDHREGYELLKSQYQKYNFIKFYERKEGFDILSYFPSINGLWNFKNFFRYHLINKKRDNFKGLLEKLLSISNYEFVMFNTDDGFFKMDFELNQDILSIIKKNPSNASYRNYIGENIVGFPEYVLKYGEYYKWNYYHDSYLSHWSFPFSIDGTIYSREGVLSILKKVAYHNPPTLEELVGIYVVRRKLLKLGFSPRKSILIGTVLNRVSVDSFNPALDIKPEFLNKKFIEGYRLCLTFPKTQDQVNVVPERVILIKNGLQEIVYEIDENGRDVQNYFGQTGTIQ